jgi:hypothetical protein
MLAARLHRFDDAERFCREAVDQTADQQAASLNLLAKREYAVMLYMRNAPGDDTKAVELLHGVIAGAERLRTPVIEAGARDLKSRIEARARAMR